MIYTLQLTKTSKISKTSRHYFFLIEKSLLIVLGEKTRLDRMKLAPIEIQIDPSIHN